MYLSFSVFSSSKLIWKNGRWLSAPPVFIWIRFVWTVKQLTYMTEGNFVMLLIQKRVSSFALCLCQASINLVDVSAHIRDGIIEMAYLMQLWRECQVTPKIPVDKLLSMKGGHWEQRKLLYLKLMWDQRHSGLSWLAGQFNLEFFCSYCIWS